MATPEGFVRLSINISKAESDALESLAGGEQRSKTEVVRELLRGLSTYRPPSTEKKTAN